MTFIEKYREIVQKNKSYVCVGLDSDFDKLPETVRQFPDPQGLFNNLIIEATKDYVCAYKINIAFYECRGAAGWMSLEATLKGIPGDIPVIIDAKRGDIGNTSKKYAQAIYEQLGADAVTLNPYLGIDAVEPFLEYEGRCAFILCHTTNKSSSEFQHAMVSAEGSSRTGPLYELVARRVAEWNKTGSCGLVVGANVPEHISRICELAPGLPLLIPGIGAQKGSVRDVVTQLRGIDFMINSSRNIIFAGEGEDFQEEAAGQAMALRDIINDLLEKG
ncbi:MAG: orotidine-5'-phosphate decarboxylase [candidate division Zixibacteria bacterium]|nr:orotidine-5'-phosphate decarboxylase [candidate division Zixibacteria bacterium]